MMPRFIASLLLIATPSLLVASPWQFTKPLEVTADHGKGIFHHLESAGRRNIAVGGNTVAIAWEDDHNGTPAIYLARKARDAQDFSSPLQLSGKGDAYEPSLAALGEDRFAVAWEEDGRIHLRLIDQGQPGPVLSLDDKRAGQANLAVTDDQLLLAYAAADAQTRHRRVYLRRIAIDDHVLQTDKRCAVDPEPLKQAQLYPSVLQLADHTVMTWEDRRLGHTIIVATKSRNKHDCTFNPPQRISEPTPGPRPPYGKGHGVTRVAMDEYADGRVLAAWADKRDFREGYDIYASHYPIDGTKLFGPNQRVQDVFGGVAQQWHPSVAGHPNGQLAVAWDDSRDDPANILLSWYQDGQWSDDLTVPGASGPGVQNHPSITFDAQGNLHLAWVERERVGGPTRLRYLFARLVD